MSNKYILILTLVGVFSIYGFVTVFAAPPLSPYNPAETLDPSCAVGDVNCSVDISSNVEIGDAILSGTPNRTLFLDASGNLADSPDFLWNDTNKVFQVGDVMGGANETSFSLDDANQNFSLINYPVADHAFAVVSDPLLGGFLPGGNMSWSNTTTGEGVSVTLGDFTGFGPGNTAVQGALAYNDPILGVTAVTGVRSTRANMSFTSPTGGDSGTDLINHDFVLSGDEVFLDYSNDTQGLYHNIQLADSGINIYTQDSVEIGDVGDTANGTVLEINDASQAFSVTGSPQAGYAETIEFGSTGVLGVLPGTSILRTKDTTDEAVGVIVGDFTLPGESDMFASLGYISDFPGLTEIADVNVQPGRVRINMESLSGGDSGTDEVDHSFTLLGEAIDLQFINEDQSILQRILLNDTGIALDSAGLLEFGDLNGLGNGTVLSVNDVTQDIVFDFNGDTYTFPAGDGLADQVLQTDGAGILSWATPSDSPITIGTSGNTLYSSGLSGTGQGNASGHNIFLGVNAGQNATGVIAANFLGQNAGQNAQSATQSNFLGQFAGSGARDAYFSNFIGANTGTSALNAFQSNFIGVNAGSLAQNASNSNFLGASAGSNALNAANATFIGENAGRFTSVPSIIGTQNAANSIFIGTNAAYFAADNGLNNTTDPDDYSILLGNYTSTGGFENSIALGQRAVNTASNQFMIGSSTRTIDETVIIGAGGTECTITTGTGIACSSDETLKENIKNIEIASVLGKLNNIRAVTYNWKNGSTEDQIGFLAQDLEEQFPELVRTNSDGKKSVFYSQITPVLVAAIQALDVKIEELFNGVADLFVRTLRARDQICVGDTCIDEQQLLELLDENNVSSSSYEPAPEVEENPAIDEEQEVEGSGESEAEPEESTEEVENEVQQESEINEGNNLEEVVADEEVEETLEPETEEVDESESEESTEEISSEEVEVAEVVEEETIEQEESAEEVEEAPEPETQEEVPASTEG